MTQGLIQKSFELLEHFLPFSLLFFENNRGVVALGSQRSFPAVGLAGGQASGAHHRSTSQGAGPGDLLGEGHRAGEGVPWSLAVFFFFFFFFSGSFWWIETGLLVADAQIGMETKTQKLFFGVSLEDRLLVVKILVGS